MEEVVIPSVESRENTPEEIDDELHEDLVSEAALSTASTDPTTPASVVAGDDNKRESSPDDSLDSNSSTAAPDPLGPLCDEEEEEEGETDPASLNPLFHVRLERQIPKCGECKCKRLSLSFQSTLTFFATNEITFFSNRPPFPSLPRRRRPRSRHDRRLGVHRQRRIPCRTG